MVDPPPELWPPLAVVEVVEPFPLSVVEVVEPPPFFPVVEVESPPEPWPALAVVDVVEPLPPFPDVVDVVAGSQPFPEVVGVEPEPPLSAVDAVDAGASWRPSSGEAPATA